MPSGVSIPVHGHSTDVDCHSACAAAGGNTVAASPLHFADMGSYAAPAVATPPAAAAAMEDQGGVGRQLAGQDRQEGHHMPCLQHEESVSHRC